MYKSMYFKNTRFRENLIKISSMCGETELSSFVNNIEDIEVLFNSTTPNVLELLDNCFNQNTYCMEVDNLNWPTEDSIMVVGSMDTVPNKDKIQGEIYSSGKELSNKIIETNLLNIGWVYNSHEGENTSFKEFVEMLGEVENEALFSTDLIKVLVEYFWEFYYD